MSRRSLVVGTVLALVLGLGAGAAFAYFTSSGSGSGAASVGTVSPVEVVAASGSVANKLYPGTSGDLKVQLNNPNSYPVTIVGLAPGTGAVTVSGASGTCASTGVTINSLSGLNVTVGTGSGSVTIPNAVSMANTSDSGCQGATFQVPIVITVHKP